MQAEVLENGPILITLENGEELALCRCGLTKTQPYCDSSHQKAKRGFPGLQIKDKLPEGVTHIAYVMLPLQAPSFSIDIDECSCGSACACHSGEEE